jgi:hypothetical protein
LTGVWPRDILVEYSGCAERAIEEVEIEIPALVLYGQPAIKAHQRRGRTTAKQMQWKVGGKVGEMALMQGPGSAIP